MCLSESFISAIKLVICLAQGVCVKLRLRIVALRVEFPLCDESDSALCEWLDVRYGRFERRVELSRVDVTLVHLNSSELETLEVRHLNAPLFTGQIIKKKSVSAQMASDLNYYTRDRISPGTRC